MLKVLLSANMSPNVGSGPPPMDRKVMVFIDGGYLREGFKRIYGHDGIDFRQLLAKLKSLSFSSAERPDVIAVYFYDAEVDPKEDPDEYEKQERYFSNIRKIGVYDVKLARLKGAKKGRKQKGVDVLIAVDMITKAFMNHYDIAIFFGGDDDFVDVVKSVKNLTGKRVVGAFYDNHISQNLQNEFYRRIPLFKKVLDDFGIEEKQKTATTSSKSP